MKSKFGFMNLFIYLDIYYYVIGKVLRIVPRKKIHEGDLDAVFENFLFMIMIK